MTKPRLFVGSSSENVLYAYALQKQLRYKADVQIWNQGFFELNINYLDGLIKGLNDSDFGVFIFAPDDMLKVREQNLASVRDNVLFEFGLFMGKLGKERTFFVLPEEQGNFRLPSDLLGISTVTFDTDQSNLEASLGPACFMIIDAIEKLGVRQEHLGKSIVDEWILNSSEKPDVYKDCGLNALYRYYGSHCQHSDSFFSSIDQNFLEAWAKQESVLVADHAIWITLRKPERANERALKEKGLLVWEERRDFKYIFNKSVVEAGHEPTIDVLQGAKQRVPSDLVDDILNHYEMTYTLDDDQSFSLSKTLQAMPQDAREAFGTGQKWSTGAFSMEYENEHLSLRYSETKRLMKKCTPVSTKEVGAIDPSLEDHYILRMSKPSKGMVIRINIDPGTGYVVQEYAASVDLYGAKKMVCIPKEPRGESGMISFEMTDWVMPGVVFFLVWGTPR